MRADIGRRARRGGVLLVLVVLFVLVLGVMGAAGHTGASTFTATTEILHLEQSARRLARAALEEAEETVRREAAQDGAGWWTALRRPYAPSSAFEPFEAEIDLTRSLAMARQEGLPIKQMTAYAVLFQQRMLGFRSGGEIIGGDETCGTISLRVHLVVDSEAAGVAGEDREIEVERLVGFRTTLPEPPAPFDQSALWVGNAEFLIRQADRTMTRLQALSGLDVGDTARKVRESLEGTLYARVGLQEATATDLGFDELAASGWQDLAGAFKSYLTRFRSEYRFVRDDGLSEEMSSSYWPAMSDAAYRERELGRADRVFADQQALMKHLGPEPVRLTGICYVEGPVTIDFAYTGRGAIVSPARVQVLRASRGGPADMLTVVSTKADLDVGQASGKVEAALLAPGGRVTGLSGKHVAGMVLAEQMTSGFEAGAGTKVELDPAVQTHAAGQMEAQAEYLQVHLDVVPLAQF